MNDWEKAFNTIPETNIVDAEIKQRQREIKQRDWQKDLPNLSNDLPFNEQVIEYLKEYNVYDTDVLQSVKNIVNENAQLKSKLASLRNML